MQWYYVRNGERQGPIDEKELSRMARDGRLKPDDLVWNQTMGARWASASTVEGLFEKPAAIPPPLPKVESAGKPSCVSALDPAWRRMTTILFAPFDIEKWLAIGFSAWLATLGEGGGGLPWGGGGPNWTASGDQKGLVEALDKEDFGAAIDKAREFLTENGALIAWIAGSVATLGVIVGLILLWLRCRGTFMLLDNVVNNRAEVGKPWKAFKRQGNSLFLWSVVYGLICLAAAIALLAVPVFSVILPCIQARGWVASALSGMMMSAFLFVVFGIVTAYIGRFLNDFVAPIMYKFGVTTTEAWGVFLGLLRANFWRLALYGLFYWVLGIGAGICVLAAVVLTCCIAGCLMIIPYIGAVVVLPVTVLFRAYSLEYLAQFGSEFRLEPEPTPKAE